MQFINSYRSPERLPITDLTYSDEPYDINFNVPLPTSLETERVQLVPFVPNIYAKIFHDKYKESPQIEQFLPIAWLNYSDFLTSLEYLLRADPSSVLFAIIDKTKSKDGADLEKSLAGMIGYIHSTPFNLTVEIGPVIIFPEFQRTFVSSNAIGLLLKLALNVPQASGWGFRRVAWSANPNNEASVRAAERLGFVKEGVHRWTWVLAPGKDGGKLPVDGKRGKGEGRDSVLLSLCWDEWEGGVKDHVERMINRI